MYKMKPALSIILFALSIFAQGQEGTETGTNRPVTTPLSKLQLPQPKLVGNVSLEETLAARRSVRQFTGQELNLEQVGQLAWAGQGITQKETGYRTAPSAGAIYPIKLYFIVKGGMYVYEPSDHSLEKLMNRDMRAAISQAALGQEAPANAACNILLTGSIEKVAAKYGTRARQFMLLEAGHIAQNILLQAVSLGLGSVPIGAFDDEKIERICRLPSGEEAIYLVSVGYPAAGPAISAKEIEQQKTPFSLEFTEPKKALLIIADERVTEKMFFDIRDVFKIAGIETTVASWRTGILEGRTKGKIEATALVADINIPDYDAIVLIGGSELRNYAKDNAILNLVRNAAENHKVIAAIDVGPRIFAEAGVLGGIRATSQNSQRRYLMKAGARYTGGDVERDGNIITARGMQSASQFAKTIIEALYDIEPQPRDERDLGRYVPPKVQKRREEYENPAPEPQ